MTIKIQVWKSATENFWLFIQYHFDAVCSSDRQYIVGHFLDVLGWQWNVMSCHRMKIKLMTTKNKALDVHFLSYLQGSLSRHCPYLTLGNSLDVLVLQLYLGKIFLTLFFWLWRHKSQWLVTSMFTVGEYQKNQANW